MRRSGKLFVVSGPSGAGKSTLSKKVVDFFDDLRFSISYTTRRPRQGEVDGVDYRFVDDERFEEMVERGEFIEHACVHGKKYGTAEKDIKEILANGMDVLLDIDVQGAEQLAEKIGSGVYIFVLPPSMEECRKRLMKRGDIGPEDIEKRLRTAFEEIKKAADYDYIIINDDLDGAFERLKAIIIAERSRKESLIEDVERILRSAK